MGGLELGGQIPDADGPVAFTRTEVVDAADREVSAIRVVGDRFERAAVGRLDQDQFRVRGRVRRVPEPDEAVGGAREGECPAVRAERRGADGRLRRFEANHRACAAAVVQSGHVVGAAGGEPAAVFARRDAVRGPVPGGRDGVPGRRVPNAEGRPGRARDANGRARSKDAQAVLARRVRPGDELARFHVPYVNDAVGPGRGEPRAGAVECQAADFTAVAAEHIPDLPGDRVRPQVDVVIRIGTRQ